MRSTIPVRGLLAAWLLVGLAACGTAAQAPPDPSEPPSGPADPVAVIDGEPVTRGALDAAVAPQIAKLDEQAYRDPQARARRPDCQAPAGDRGEAPRDLGGRPRRRRGHRESGTGDPGRDRRVRHRQPRAARRRSLAAHTADPRIPREPAGHRPPHGISGRAAREDEGRGPAGTALHVPRAHRPEGRTRPRPGQRAGHRGRVLGLPLSVLPPGAADAAAAAGEVPDRGAPRVQALPARRASPAGAPRRRGELVCTAAGSLLAVPRISSTAARPTRARRC